MMLDVTSRDAIEAFYARVNARAEQDIQGGRPITGAHHRALEAEINVLRATVPLSARVSRAGLQPRDVIVLETDAIMSDDQVKRVKFEMSLVFPGHPVVVIERMKFSVTGPAPELEA